MTEGTIRMAANSELRHLTVENRGGQPYATAVNIREASDTRLSHVAAWARDGSTATYGIQVDLSLLAHQNT